MLRRTFILLGVVIAVLAGAGSAAAATITVNTTSDDNSQGDGQCSLRKAIEDVDAPGSGQTDCVAAAFGANTIVLGAKTYQLGFGNNDLSIAATVRNLTISGAGESKTVINGAQLANRVFELGGGATVTMSDLTIENGHAPTGAFAGAGGTGGNGANGGAILTGGALTLNDVAITGSQAGSGGPGGFGSPGGDGGNGGAGGGIYNTGNLTLNGVTLSNDHAGNGGPGGPGAQGTSGGNGGTGGTGGDGGGVSNAGGTLTINGATLSGDSAGNGGAGGWGGSGTSTTGGTGGDGGRGANAGGLATDGGTLMVVNATVASNLAGGGGTGGTGGAGTTKGGNGGHGGPGGSGGGVGGTSPTAATLLQTTVAGNQDGAGGTGGGAGSGAPAGTAGPNGPEGTGGGVWDLGSAITLENSLLDTNQPGANCSGPILDGGYNLSAGDSTTTTCPTSFATGDPNLGALQDNGGPAPTIGLGNGSAAIDRIPASGAHCPATDERGVARPSGSKCDIGAYEVAPPVAVSEPASKVTPTGATLNGLVTPNAGSASVKFEYGTTTSYGKSTSSQTVGGVAATRVSAKLSNLKSNATYHYRVVVSTMDGTDVGADETFVTGRGPVIKHLRLKPKAFKPSGSATVTYTDSAAAETTFTVLRCTKVSHGQCAATKRVRRFKHHDAVGSNKLVLSGHGLKTGTYVLQATARVRGRTGNTVSVEFKVT